MIYRGRDRANVLCQGPRKLISPGPGVAAAQWQVVELEGGEAQGKEQGDGVRVVCWPLVFYQASNGETMLRLENAYSRTDIP